MDSFIETFHIDWKIIIAQVINFAIVLFVLQYLALKPIKKLMSERTERINEGLNNATKNELLVKNTQKEYEEVLQKARNEAHEIFQNGKKDAELKKNEMIEKAGKDVEIMIINGKKVLEAEKNKMISEAKEQIVSLVVLATEKLLETNNNDSYDKKSADTIKNI